LTGGFGTAGPDEVVEDFGEPLAFAKMMEDEGMHYINVSAGIAGSEITQPSKKFPEGVYRLFGWAQAVKQAVGHSGDRIGLHLLKGREKQII
jgi:hypothetical protein